MLPSVAQVFVQCGLCMGLDRRYSAGKYESYVLVIYSKGMFLASVNRDFTEATDFSTPAVKVIKFFSRA
jgi:hypothetical protein